MDEKFTCPHCGQHVAIANPPLGARVSCPDCGKLFTLVRVTAAKAGLLQSWLVGFVVAVLIGAGILVAPAILKKGAPSPAPTEATAATPASKAPATSSATGKPKSLTDWLDVLASTEQNTRETARNALRKMGPNAVPALLEMVDQLPSTDKRRGYALEGLGCAGSRHGPEADVVLKLMKDENPRMRMIAATAARRLYLAPQVTVPIMLEMLTDSDPKVRRGAAVNLGFMPGMGPLLRDALFALEKASADEDQTVADAAKAAVKNLQKVHAGFSQASPPPVEK